MFKKLPEFNEEPEPPSSPLKVNDVELDEELEKLGLSDVLKKYSSFVIILRDSSEAVCNYIMRKFY